MIKETIIILFLIGLISCKNSHQSNQQEYVDRIDIVYYPNHQVILVPVFIGNVETLLLLDTGAPTTIDSEIFDSLNLDSINYHTGYDYYGNQKENITETAVPSMLIGNIEYKEINSSVLDMAQLFQDCNHKIGGYLGSDFFMDKVVQFDMANEQLTIATTEDSLDLKGHYQQGFKTPFGQKSPFVFVNFPSFGLHVEAEFDIGSKGDLLVINRDVSNKLFEKGHISPDNILDTLNKSDNGKGVFGEQRDSLNFIIEVDSIVIFGTNFYNCPIKTANTPYTRIGSAMLKYGVVTINFRNKQFYFKPYSNSKIDLSRKLGFSFNWKDGDYIVTSVKKGSEVDKYGIKPGFKIIEINSIGLDSISKCDFLMINWKSKFLKEGKIELVFKSIDNKRIEIELPY